MSVCLERRAIVDFANRCKYLICSSVGIDYTTRFAPVSLFRNALPIQFATIIPFEIPQSTWTNLYNAIPHDVAGMTRIRCVQIIAEFARLDAVLASTVDDVRMALAAFYEPHEDRTCGWMKAAAVADIRLFNQLVYRVTSGAVAARTGAAFKRAIVYSGMMASLPRRIYLDDPDQPTSRLITLRRAYEHILFGRFQLDDLTNDGALLQAVLTDKPYTNSAFTNVGRGMHFHRAKDVDLVLYPPKGKSFPTNHYRGALELMSCDGNVYCDRRLEHHLIPGPTTSMHVMFDLKPIFLWGAPSQAPSPMSVQEMLTTRLTHLEMLPTYNFSIPTTTTTTPTLCKKARLLCQPTDIDYERDVASASIHVKDFLLWLCAMPHVSPRSTKHESSRQHGDKILTHVSSSSQQTITDS